MRLMWLISMAGGLILSVRDIDGRLSEALGVRLPFVVLGAPGRLQQYPIRWSYVKLNRLEWAGIDKSELFQFAAFRRVVAVKFGQVTTVIYRLWKWFNEGQLKAASMLRVAESLPWLTDTKGSGKYSRWAHLYF
jgi:hypothetical protein